MHSLGFCCWHLLMPSNGPATFSLFLTSSIFEHNYINQRLMCPLVVDRLQVSVLHSVYLCLPQSPCNPLPLCLSVSLFVRPSLCLSPNSLFYACLSVCLSAYLSAYSRLASFLVCLQRLFSCCQVHLSYSLLTAFQVTSYPSPIWLGICLSLPLCYQSHVSVYTQTSFHMYAHQLYLSISIAPLTAMSLLEELPTTAIYTVSEFTRRSAKDKSK